MVFDSLTRAHESATRFSHSLAPISSERRSSRRTYTIARLRGFMALVTSISEAILYELTAKILSAYAAPLLRDRGGPILLWTQISGRKYSTRPSRQHAYQTCHLALDRLAFPRKRNRPSRDQELLALVCLHLAAKMQILDRALVISPSRILVAIRFGRFRSKDSCDRIQSHQTCLLPR